MGKRKRKKKVEEDDEEAELKCFKVSIKVQGIQG